MATLTIWQNPLQSLEQRWRYSKNAAFKPRRLKNLESPPTVVEMRQVRKVVSASTIDLIRRGEPAFKECFS